MSEHEPKPSSRRLSRLLIALVGFALAVYAFGAYAHRSGCHAAHSCPSDTDSYVCGDRGYCTYCPDNQYCLKRKPRPKSQTITAPTSTDTGSPATSSAAVIQANAWVARVVDGDTFVAHLDRENREFMIRMLGINTPETVDPRRPVECFGKEASARLKSLLDGKRARLDADPQADERDKYGRLLRNVFLEDGTDVNAIMVRDGYAYAYLSFPLNPKRKAELKKLQAEAKAAKRGLWSPDACGTNR